MATTTTNLGLTKPIGTEQALVSVINGNMDIIDSKVGAVPANKNVQGQIDSLSDHIAKSYNTATCSYGNVNFYRFGAVVVVFGDLNLTSSLSAGSIIATGLPIPYILKPTTYTQGGYMGTIVSSSNAISSVQIDKNGAIIAETATVTSYCRLFMTYITEA